MREFSKEWWSARNSLTFCGRRIQNDWCHSCGYMETGMEIPYHMCIECFEKNRANGIDPHELGVGIYKLDEI